MTLRRITLGVLLVNEMVFFAASARGTWTPLGAVVLAGLAGANGGLLSAWWGRRKDGR